MLLELVGSILILILTFGITFVLKESFRVILLCLSFEIGLFSSFDLIPDYFLVIGIIIFAYSVYNLIWGTKDE
jgi:hypothetical protein